MPVPPARAITTSGRPAHVHPASANDLCGLAGRLGLRRPQPTTVIVSATGESTRRTRACADDVPVVLLTTDAGAGGLRRLDSAAVEVVVAGDHDRVEAGAILAALAARDLKLVVCEGGPGCSAALWARLVDELFLTVAPQIAGRSPDRRDSRSSRASAFRSTPPPGRAWPR